MRNRFAFALLCVSLAAPQASAQSEGRAPGEPECSVPGYQVFAARTGVDPVLERAGKALVATEKPFHLALLSLPGCKLEPFFDAGTTWPAHPISITTAGAVLYDKGSQSSKGLQMRRAGAEPETLVPPADGGNTVWAPVLSGDGSAVVWLVAKEGNDGRTEFRVFVRELASGAERSFVLDSKAGDYELVAANVGEDEYVLCAGPDRMAFVDGNGAPKSPPAALTALERCSASFRRVTGGWIAWDNLRLDDRAVRLQWSLPEGKDSHEFPSARIESVSVTPDGKRVAVSAPAANRLTDKGSIVVLGLPEGKVLFQRDLDAFIRPAVAFLDATHLAVTAGTHVEVVYVP
jgi:hypothetical protein